MYAIHYLWGLTQNYLVGELLVRPLEAGQLFLPLLWRSPWVHPGPSPVDSSVVLSRGSKLPAMLYFTM